MKINEINSQKYISGVQQDTGKKEPVQKQQAKNGKDEILISFQGKKLSHSKRLLQIAKEKLKSVPDIRLDKIEASVQKIEAGEYSKPEAVGSIAESLLQKPEFQAIVQQKAQNKIIPSDRVQEIRNKMTSDFYAKPEVVDQIAQKIIADFKQGA